MSGGPLRVLVAGWFSFANGHATAGDLLSRDVLGHWLADAGVPFDICTDPPFVGGIDWRTADPDRYSHVVFVCGPFGRGELEARFLSRFARCRLIGLNLSMSVPLDQWNPFDLLVERDSTRAANADVVFAARQLNPPVVGLCEVEVHDEAPELARAHADLRALLRRRGAAVVPIDTRLDVNETGLHAPGEVEALIARVDLLATTRLHGLVMALKNGVPAIAVDAVPGGGKITRQCRTVGWPNVLSIDSLDPAALDAAYDYALSPTARQVAREAAARADDLLRGVRDTVLAGVLDDESTAAGFAARTSGGALRAFVADMATLLPVDDPPPPPPSFGRRVLRRAAALLPKV